MKRRGRSLRAHLMLLYVLLAVLSGVIVPALVRDLSLSGFQDYLGRRRASDLEELGASLEALYREDGGWNPRRVMDVLRSSAGGMPSDIVLLDSGGNRVLPMGHGRGWGMRGKNRVSIPLSLEGRRIGTLDANGRPPSSRLEQEFVSRMALYALVGAAAMIVVACGLGYVVAGGLSRPVIRAAERARRISRGEYELEPEPPSGIREMDMLSRGVEELGRSLAGQERLRKRLMTDIAHELRTPLTVVRSQVEAVADGVWEVTPERLALCAAEIERLSDLIGEVESLTRLEGEILSVRLRDTDLAAFLNTVLDTSEPLFARSGVTLHRSLEGNVRANVDSERFRSVIDNLLSNALRYSEAGGRVEVRLRSRDGSAVVEVEDAGTGIDAADLPHVFDRFYRADAARARATGGRGIGLAIAKAAVEAHGGTIEVSSRLGEGSRFTVKLPLGGEG
ncbi:ATP-binding protein [uncultured Fretibacterium sp.]|mgnify:FL=1|uniref:sensor histidine kinase n=1 Tax=uncultured Fretibacterium sp. TaxID=1678694 RepID=UPI0026275D53|nr:ATP-binding protein [uncultured Fretibacterium sp.]